MIVDGRLFLVTQFGSAASYELSTGRKLWEKRLTGHGAACGSWSSMVHADGKLLVPNQVGEVFLLKPGPDYEMIASNQAADETTCSSLAIASGVIYLRTYSGLWCFGKDNRDGK